MANIGNPFTPSEKKAVLCGSGELGKEVAIELERYGVNVVAVDKYPGAPAMQVAQSSHVLSMLDGDALAQVIEEEKPDLIIPEVEAIATPKLIELEEKGYKVIPTAHATFLTMNREGIRRLARQRSRRHRVLQAGAPRESRAQVLQPWHLSRPGREDPRAEESRR